MSTGSETSATTLQPATKSESSSFSISSSKITSTANLTTILNSTMTTSSMMTLSTSSIDWPTNVTTGGAVAETGLSMAALAVAAGAMGLVLGEL